MRFTTVAVIIPILNFINAAPIADANLPLPSFGCMQVALGIELTHSDQGCLPITQVLPLIKQIQQNPAASQQQISQVVNDICTAPTCSTDFLTKLQQDIQSSCQGSDAQNPLVQAFSSFIRNYSPARAMLCLKDTASNNYCSVEEAQAYLQQHPNVDTSNLQPPVPTQETCSTSCGKGWLDLYNQYSPQYPDLKQCPYISQLPTVCQAST
ncbi:hypothetical protein K493DRAFT_320163 [Basidiobolus meristosporus CBS 931.73]|uniref:DUF7729 domain-containing protein n=1 Tax=Basidiobolus meristosporus CBS 931.73 TaxID=1314790 RepID=A0A1Y1XF64_9FUNG|nr:hypothetical protein K493DRAFT_320163 [Basidiobolus meristosporus CBS 931.73]|eukprot:ORX84056.1 hypothetical protein K493DRAFT_320163 [Basidiobolus meristosporus CBS 931.73]